MDIVMCGVGGQGTVLAARVMGEAALKSGFQVRTSEIIGMSQREGAVVSQVRIADHLEGALIPDGGADYYLGFELAEAVRNINKMKKGGKAIINSQKIIPPSVYLGKSTYDEGKLLEYLAQHHHIVIVDAYKLAGEAGSTRAINAVLLGALAAANPLLQPETILHELINRLPEQLRDINTRAFNLGKLYYEEEMR
ncbi:MAG: indolepyruvate oxidoreductase subunit beta [Syntrophomonadaceae bacterium]|jgi:indolepyruvate ferredoxin oxidoreductase beta subunit